MIIQRINREDPEVVMIISRNDSTATISKGFPAVWKMDGTRDGLDVEDTNTGDAAKSTLLAGLADVDIVPGGFGLLQCYGIRTDAPMRKSGIATSDNALIGDALVLDTALSLFSGKATGVVSAYLAGVVMAEALASSGSTATTTGVVFLRLM